MGSCFVIQPFDDGGKFDKRYEDVFAPAIREAGLKAYRVDRDPSVSIPIEDIQAGIEASQACLADITTDNANVWFELGYAIAARRDVVLVCSKERTTPFPFDVQHRSIIKYSTDSSSDFDDLRIRIESKIKAVSKRREKLGQVAHMQPIANVEGLNQHELATLVAVAEEIDELDDTVAVSRIRQAMGNAGFTKIATTLGLKMLVDKKLLEPSLESYQGEEYTVYGITPLGMSWLLENQDKLSLRPDVPF